MSKSIERMVIERALQIMKKGWCDYSWAKDAKGDRVAWYSPRAMSFCAEGAVRRAVRELAGKRNYKLAENILRRMPENIMVLNDGEGKRAVMKLMRQRLAEL